MTTPKGDFKGCSKPGGEEERQLKRSVKGGGRVMSEFMTQHAPTSGNDLMCRIKSFFVPRDERQNAPLSKTVTAEEDDPDPDPPPLSVVVVSLLMVLMESLAANAGLKSTSPRGLAVVVAILCAWILKSRRLVTVTACTRQFFSCTRLGGGAWQ